MSNMSEQEMMEVIKNAAEPTTASIVEKIANENSGIRNLLIIGMGDGGCNIADAISKKIPKQSFVIAYNTSTSNMDKISANIHLVPPEEDGAGRVRAYSKDVFKQGTYKTLLDNVQEVCDKMQKLSYIIICTTAGGGTGSGSSPMAAKLIADNVDIPVIIVGVYPNAEDDATAQFNAIEWQREVEKTGLPYMIWDNDQAGSIGDVHKKINESIADVMSLFAGVRYGSSNISMIDSRNLYMLLAHTGGRIVSSISTVRPSSKETLDDYLDTMIQNSMQPLPSNSTALGVFVKGPKELLGRVGTETLARIKNYGQPILHFNHLEESDELTIAIIMAGCTEPSDRIMVLKNRYDDIMKALRASKGSIMDGFDDITNPLGSTSKKKISNGPDFSALDL